MRLSLSAPLTALFLAGVIVPVLAATSAHGADGDVRNNLLDLLRKTYEAQDATTNKPKPPQTKPSPNTRVLRLEKIEDIDIGPPPPEPTPTVRRRDFDTLPDHGRSRGIWSPASRTNGKVTSNSEEWAHFTYAWGKIHVRWRGVGNKPWGIVGRHTQPAISHVELPITKETVYTFFDTKKSIIIHFHVKKGYRLDDGNRQVLSDKMDRSRFPNLARRYYENLAPYALDRVELKQQPPQRRASRGRSKPPRSRATKDPPLLGN